ncbi:phenylacetate-CoA oxygenase subunit PaaC [soil metagenome]
MSDAVAREILGHADDNLVMAQQLSQWVAAAPDLELDIALGNIALDHLGVARSLLTRFGELEGVGRTEDDLAMFRGEREFTNLLICEQPNGDFGYTIARQLVFDAYQVGLWEMLTDSTDSELSAVAAKARLEARYHWQHSQTWAALLGHGTEESKRRMQAGLGAVARFVDELFNEHPELRPGFDERIGSALGEAGLELQADPFPQRGGRAGLHTEYLGHLLAEMQSLARAHPGVKW